MNAANTRMNMYGPIHKGLRARMAEAVTALGRMDGDDAQQVESTLDLVDDLLDICIDHLEHENRFVHTAMEARAPGSADSATIDHAHHQAEIAALKTLCSHVATCRGHERTELAHRLYLAFSTFVAENLAHMRFEEEHNNAVLWTHYSDEELLAIEQALVASIPEAKRPRALRLIVPALAHAERAQFLARMREGMPAPAFAGVLAMLMPLLDACEQAKLRTALGLEDAAAAA